MSDFFSMFQGIYSLFAGNPAVAIIRVVLILVGVLLIYFSYKKILDPLILLPMGITMIAVNAGTLIFGDGHTGNLFVDPLVSDAEGVFQALQVNFLQPLYTYTFSNGLIACFIFMGIGAITDIDFLMATPMASMLLAVGAELGTIFVLPIAMLWGLDANQAAAVAIVGGADGPMVLFTSLTLAKDLFVPITVIGYVYLSLTYAGYPFLAKAMIPKKMRGIAMNPRAIGSISTGEKMAFIVAALVVLDLLFPVAAPLFTSFFIGVAIKEMDIARLREFLEGPLLNGSTFILGIVLGALFSADIVSNPVVFKLLVLGMLALLLSGVGGVLGGLIYYKISRGKANPLLGLAAVSCVPTTAKIAQKCASESNKFAMILPYAMGPNVAGVITTAIVCGIYVNLIPMLK